MSSRKSPLAMQLELLRLRAAAHRAELGLARQELAKQTQAWRRAAGMFGAVAGALRGKVDMASWIGAARAIFEQRGWLLPATIVLGAAWRARRSMRLKLIVAGACAALVAVLLRRYSRPAPGADKAAPEAAAAPATAAPSSN